MHFQEWLHPIGMVQVEKSTHSVLQEHFWSWLLIGNQTQQLVEQLQPAEGERQRSSWSYIQDLSPWVQLLWGRRFHHFAVLLNPGMQQWAQQSTKILQYWTPILLMKQVCSEMSHKIRCRILKSRSTCSFTHPLQRSPDLRFKILHMYWQSVLEKRTIKKKHEAHDTKDREGINECPLLVLLMRAINFEFPEPKWDGANTPGTHGMMKKFSL